MTSSRLSETVSMFWLSVILFCSLTGFLLQLFVLSPGHAYSPIRWCVATFIPIYITISGINRNRLSHSGGYLAFWVGFFLTLAHPSFFLGLLTFFYSSSKATKFKQERKRQIEGKSFKEGGRRNWVQVFCNGSVATAFSLMYILDVGPIVLPVDFTHEYRASWLSCAILGALACCNGDTWASEIGSAWSETSLPRLITTLKPVPRGTNGGVSLIGLVVSILGGMLVGLSFVVGNLMFSSRLPFERASSQWSIVLLGGFAGLFGSVVDSILGATCQYSGINEEGAIVEEWEKGVKHISGLPILTNNGVNLISSLISAMALPIAGSYIY